MVLILLGLGQLGEARQHSQHDADVAFYNARIRLQEESSYPKKISLLNEYITQFPDNRNIHPLLVQFIGSGGEQDIQFLEKLLGNPGISDKANLHILIANHLVNLGVDSRGRTQSRDYYLRAQKELKTAMSLPRPTLPTPNYQFTKNYAKYLELRCLAGLERYQEALKMDRELRKIATESKDKELLDDLNESQKAELNPKLPWVAEASKQVQAKELSRQEGQRIWPVALGGSSLVIGIGLLILRTRWKSKGS